jgi:hypothetical protein
MTEGSMLRSIVSILALACGFAMATLADGSSSATSTRSAAVAGPVAGEVTEGGTSGSVAPAGVEGRAGLLAESLSQLLGVAVSPLLVFSTIGAIEYWSMPPGAPVPLHARPLVWGSFMAVLLLSFLTSLKCLVLPSPLTPVIDAVKYFEQHASGLLAAGILIPSVAKTMDAASIALPAAAAGSACLHAGFLDFMKGFAIQAMLLFVFMAVRIVSMTFDALILISPITFVDAVLRSIRLSIVLGGSALALTLIKMEPWGPFVLLALIAMLVLFCIIVAGWCVRLNLFAASCAWDILTLRWWRTRAERGPIRAFAASSSLGPAVRTRGSIVVGDDGVQFRWRPWFVLPSRSVPLSTESVSVVRGFVISSVVREYGDDERTDLLHLPPRYRSHHETVAQRLGVQVGEGGLRRGIRAAWKFVKRMFSRRAAEPAHARSQARAQRPAQAPPSMSVGEALMISGRKTLASIQSEFTAAFPQLGILFFPRDAAGKMRSGERAKLLESRSVLSAVSAGPLAGEVEFRGESTVGSIEGFFRERCGLVAQVCYMRDGKPVATSEGLDGAKLSELDRRAQEQGRGPFRYPLH